MRQTPLFIKFALTALLFLAAFAVWAMVDNFDLLRKSNEEMRRAIQSNTDAVNNLKRQIQTGALAMAASENDGTTTNNTNKLANFHNHDIRDPQAEDGGTRTTSVMAFTGSLNYLINNEATLGDLWGYCNDTLAARNSKNPKKFEPRMAESWTMSPDGKVFTIKLRPNIFWHDFTDPVTGKRYSQVPVTSRDFTFYFESMRNMELPCDPIRNYFKDLDRIEIIDDLTFKVIWKEIYFLSESVTLSLWPYPRHLYRPEEGISDKEFADNLLKNKAERNQLIVGCGPYVFAGYDKGDRMMLARNENYYGPLPSIKKIVIRQISDPEKTLIEFKKGSIDRTGLTPVQWTEQTGDEEFHTVCNSVDDAYELSLKNDTEKKKAFLSGKDFGDYKFEKYIYRTFAYSFISWNMRRPLFTDKRVRRALTQGINRERILKEVYKNLNSITTGPFLPHSLYYDHTVKAWQFDLEKSKELLKEAGWEDTDGDGLVDKDIDGDGKRDPFSFTFLMIQNSSTQGRYVPMIKSDLQKLGINMNIKSIEWAVFTEQLDSFDFDACSLAWSGGIESDPYQLWHSSQADSNGASNLPGFKNAEGDALIEKGRVTLDIDKRIEIFKKFHRLLHEEQPYTFLFAINALLAQDKRFCNSIIYQTGMSTDEQWVPRRLQSAD